MYSTFISFSNCTRHKASQLLTVPGMDLKLENVMKMHLELRFYKKRAAYLESWQGKTLDFVIDSVISISTQMSTGNILFPSIL